MLISETGEVAFSNQAFYPTHFPAHGWAEQDPQQILNSIDALVAECTSANAVDIGTVSISCAMHSLMAVDAKGTALSPLIIWSDMRSTGVAKNLKLSSAGAELYAVTGTPVHPMSPTCKLLWIREFNPDLFGRAFKFISIKEFVIWHWCERWLVDYSIASATGMFDVHGLAWSDKALALTGVTPARLSEPVSPYQRIKLTNNRLGLASGTTVTLGASDGCLANLGSEATGPGDLSITIGTSGAVRMVSDKVSNDPQGRVFNYRLDEDKFVTGGATNNGTVVIDWFARNFLGAEQADMSGFIQRAMRVTPGSEGLLFLPFVFGERAPYHNPDLRGMYFGLGQHHTLDHMTRSLLEGICFEVRTLVEAVEQSVRPVTSVWASGGFVRSVDWVQLLANILGRDVTVKNVVDASSLGAAIMGFRSFGVHPAFRRQDTERTYKADLTLKAQYDKLFGIFSRIVPQLSQEFSEIALIQTTRET
jgi:gluconokinase